MSATVVIIGRNPANRMSDDDIQLAMTTWGARAAGNCSPNCGAGTAALVSAARASDAPADIQDGLALSFESHESLKPAEAWVLNFSDSAAAQGWLKAVGRSRLAGKTVLILDPATAPAPAMTPATPPDPNAQP
jgi:hypothetical protein